MSKYAEKMITLVLALFIGGGSVLVVGTTIVKDIAKKSEVRYTYFKCVDYSSRSEATCTRRTKHMYGGKTERQHKDRLTKTWKVTGTGVDAK